MDGAHSRLYNSPVGHSHVRQIACVPPENSPLHFATPLPLRPSAKPQPSLPHYSPHSPSQARPIGYRISSNGYRGYENQTIYLHSPRAHYPHRNRLFHPQHNYTPYTAAKPPPSYTATTLPSPPKPSPLVLRIAQNSLDRPPRCRRYPDGLHPCWLSPTYRVTTGETSGQTHPPPPPLGRSSYRSAGSCHSYWLSRP